MEYLFKCACGKRMRVKEKQVGHSGFCKDCGRPVSMTRDVLTPVSGPANPFPDAGITSNACSDLNPGEPPPITGEPASGSAPPEHPAIPKRERLARGILANAIDVYLRFVFACSKVVAALFILVCTLIMSGACWFWLVAGPQSMSVPTFADVLEMTQKNDSESSGQSYSAIEVRRAVEQRFGEEIEDIVRQNGLPVRSYDIFIARLAEMDPSYRRMYVKGLRSFLDDASKHIKKEGGASDITIGGAADAYNEVFAQFIAAEEEEQVAASARRLTAFTVGACALAIMILFMIIPVLLQIEQNTRSA